MVALGQLTSQPEAENLTWGKVFQVPAEYWALISPTVTSDRCQDFRQPLH